ncbi:MAG: hypothetical protein R2748_32965 [Bryobacterales bacterium]
MAKDWAAVREQFPVLSHWRYLNSATFGPVPRCATEAIRSHFEDRDRTGSLDFLSWFDRLDEVRASAATLIGATADDIAFLPSAGVGLSWILNGVDWAPGRPHPGSGGRVSNNLYAPGSLGAKA